MNQSRDVLSGVEGKIGNYPMSQIRDMNQNQKRYGAELKRNKEKPTEVSDSNLPLLKSFYTSLAFGLYLFSLCSIPLSVSAGSGTSTANFLKLGTGARPEGMGGVSVAVADDVNAVYGNPGGLAWIKSSEAGFMYSALAEQMGFHVMSVALPLNGASGTVGFSVAYFTSGMVDGYDAGGQVTSGFSNEDWLGTIAFGRGFGALKVGVAVKFLWKRLSDITAAGVMGDLGVQWEIPGMAGLRIGGALKHAGSGLQFVAERDPFPLTVQMGVAYLGEWWGRQFTLGCEVEYSRDQSYGVGIGGEVEVWPWVSLRGGYAFIPDRLEQGFRAGIEVGTPVVGMEYAYVPFGMLGSAHRLSMAFRFGAWGSENVIGQNLETSLQRAQTAYLTGDYVEAWRVYQNILMLQPSCQAARKGMERIDQDVSRSGTRDVIQRSIEYHFRVGEEAVRLSQWWLARERFEAVLSLDPAHEGARRALSKVREEHGEISGSASAPGVTLKAAEAETPARQWLGRAVAAYGAGDFEGTLGFLENALKAEPGMVEARALSLVAQEKRGQAQAATLLANEEKRRREGEEKKQLAIQAAYSGGLAALQSGDLEGAVKNFSEVIELEPTHSLAQDQLETARRRLVKRDIAAKVQGWLDRGEEAEKTGGWKEAVTAYEQALKADAGSAVARAGVARTRVQLKKVQEAQAEEYYTQGLKAYGQGRLEEAKQALMKAVELASDHAKAAQTLERVKKEMGR